MELKMNASAHVHIVRLENKVDLMLKIAES
jgi:hypothetical protein